MLPTINVGTAKYNHILTSLFLKLKSNRSLINTTPSNEINCLAVVYRIKLIFFKLYHLFKVDVYIIQNYRKTLRLYPKTDT